MSSDRKALVRFTFTKDRVKHGIMTVWSGNYPGTYSLSRDKGSDRFPAIGLFDALKSWGMGSGFIDISVESQREQRGGQDRPARGGEDFGSGGFGNDEVPF